MHSTQHPGDPPEPIPSSHQIPPIPVTSAPSLRWGSTHPPHRQVGGTPMDRSVYPRLYPCCFRERRTERKKERKSHLVTRQTQSPGVLDPSCHTSRIGAAAGSIDARQHPWTVDKGHCQFKFWSTSPTSPLSYPQQPAVDTIYRVPFLRVYEPTSAPAIHCFAYKNNYDCWFLFPLLLFNLKLQICGDVEFWATFISYICLLSVLYISTSMWILFCLPHYRPITELGGLHVISLRTLASISLNYCGTSLEREEC